MTLQAFNGHQAKWQQLIMKDKISELGICSAVYEKLAFS